jgi:hypothetical protein
MAPIEIFMTVVAPVALPRDPGAVRTWTPSAG